MEKSALRMYSTAMNTNKRKGDSMQSSGRLEATASAAAFATGVLWRRTFNRARIPLQRKHVRQYPRVEERRSREERIANVRQRCHIPQHRQR